MQHLVIKQILFGCKDLTIYSNKTIAFWLKASERNEEDWKISTCSFIKDRESKEKFQESISNQ